MVIISYNFAITRPTHRISIRSSGGIRTGSDKSKDFQISADGHSLLDIHRIIGEIAASNLRTMLAENIIYDGCDSGKATHHIVIIQKTELGRKTKCYSVSFPSYSSTEISEALRRVLWGEA